MRNNHSKIYKNYYWATFFNVFYGMDHLQCYLQDGV